MICTAIICCSISIDFLIKNRAELGHWKELPLLEQLRPMAENSQRHFFLLPSALEEGWQESEKQCIALKASRRLFDLNLPHPLSTSAAQLPRNTFSWSCETAPRKFFLHFSFAKM